MRMHDDMPHHVPRSPVRNHRTSTICQRGKTMRTGYSMFLREHVEATELDHQDCRDFQITCPSCHEAVFKVGERGAKRQHLSHYPASRNDVQECERRVAAISRQRMDVEDATSRGQHLKLFQDVFIEASLLSMVRPGADVMATVTPIRDLVDTATSRVSFRSFARAVSTALRKDLSSSGGADRFVGDGSEYVGGNLTRFWIDRQRSFARDFVRHIATPNAARTLYYALAIGIYKNRRIMAKIGIDDPYPEELNEITYKLLYGSDGDLSSMLKKARKTRLFHRPGQPTKMDLAVLICMQALRGTLIEFPYVDTTLKAATQDMESNSIN